MSIEVYVKGQGRIKSFAPSVMLSHVKLICMDGHAEILNRTRRISALQVLLQCMLQQVLQK
mgnify:CR=1 FL=1